MTRNKYGFSVFMLVMLFGLIAIVIAACTCAPKTNAGEKEECEVISSTTLNFGYDSTKKIKCPEGYYRCFIFRGDPVSCTFLKEGV